MSFFFTHVPDEPRMRRRRGVRIGWTLLLVAILGVTVMAWVPSSYVVRQPGSTYDTLGSVTIDDEEVELIEIPGETVYPTEGSLRLLTVGVVGSRRTPVPWLDIVRAWFDPSKSVIPTDLAYPMGQTVKESKEQNKLLMLKSQQAAEAAALIELGYEIPTVITVREIVPGSPADGRIEVGEQILAVNGVPLADVENLQATVTDSGVTTPIGLTLVRDGSQRQISLTPAAGFASQPIIGVTVKTSYDFPFEVNIQLENVGGPSAGMMFALGIIDKLTPGAMTGGEEIAGTGTVSASGNVGPIGGIRQKLYGATAAGADWFLAPERNCDDVVGHIPVGLTVFSVATLEDALAAVDAIGNGDTDELADCSDESGSA